MPSTRLLSRTSNRLLPKRIERWLPNSRALLKPEQLENREQPSSGGFGPQLPFVVPSPDDCFGSIICGTPSLPSAPAYSIATGDPDVFLRRQASADITSIESQDVLITDAASYRAPTVLPTSTAAPNRRELVIFAAELPDREALLRDMLVPSDDRAEYEFVELAGNGIEEISAAIRGRQSLDAVHIFSHGSAGSLSLGSEQLNSATLTSHAAEIRDWSLSLNPDADILLYGCNLAQTQAGLQFLQNFSILTGADVAASTDITGHAIFGANWVLEYATGQIETATALDTNAQAQWQGLLATFTVTNTNNSGAGSLRQAILNANANTGLDTITFNIPITDSNRFYHQNDSIAGSLSNVSTTTLPDGSIADFDPDYPYAQHTWFRINLDPGSPALAITDRVIIDGYSQPGASQNTLAIGHNANLRIELTSIGADGDSGLDFHIGSSGSTVRGLTINRFDFAGVWTDPGVNNITIQGNFLGTDITGTIDRGNGDGGVHLRSSNNLVGGPNPADRNVISGNDGRGVVTFTFGPIESGNIVRNNYIGVDATGLRALGNTTAGIQVWNQSGMQILDNVISSNSTDGVWIRSGSSASGTVIQGNLIGLGTDGVTARGNGNAGILIESTATNTTVGDILPGQGNTIAYNTADGIAVTSGTGAAIRGNSIFSNGGLGIDLNNNGVTANDNGDGDGGANRLQNYPVITSAFTNGSNVTIAGSLNSTGSRNFRVEFFANTAVDGTGFGEGQRYLGFTNVTTNGSGNGTFSVNLSAAVAGGEFISATATDLTTNDTSEFAQNRVASPSPPTVTLPAGPVSYTLGNPLTIIDATATVTDLDSPDFNTGTLTVSITANASADDRLEINDGGIIQLSGNTVRWKSSGPFIDIGTFGGGTGLTPLVVTLNANATPAQTQDLLRAIGYRNVSVTAPTYSVTAQFVLTDGDGGTSTPQSETINILGVNQAPVNTVPGPQSTTINTPLMFSSGNGNQISSSDPDAGAASVQVTLTATNGTLTLGGGGTLANPVGNEVLTNSTTTNTQSEPAIARAPNGNYVLVWSGYRNAPNPAVIIFQLYDANGNTIGGQTIANSTSTSTNIQSQPDVAMDQNGNFVIVWTSPGQDNADGSRGIYGQRFNNLGAAQGSEFLINTTTTDHQDRPAVAMHANGDFVVVWVDKVADGNKEGIFGQRFNAAGVKQGGQFLVNNITFDTQDHPDVAMDANGNFVVTWSDKVNDGDNYGIFARRFAANGTALADQFLVNTRTDKAQENPSIAMAPDGKFVIVWESKHKDGNSQDVYGQMFNALGSRVGPTEFQVNTFENFNQRAPSVSMDAGGNFAVVWESVNQDNPGELSGGFPVVPGVYLQQFDETGAMIGAERLVNTTVAGAQDTPVVAMDADGDIVVAWHGNGSGDTNGIFQRRYNNATELTFSAGDGVADTTMTFTGPLADVNAALNGMIFTPNLNFTGLATVTITVNDQGNTGSGGAKSDSDTVNITVSGNTPPTINSNGGGATASINVAENTTAVTTVTATDIQAPPQTLTYSIVPGGDGIQFAINPSTGVLTFIAAPDFENPTDTAFPFNVYEVTVQVSDGAGGIDTQAISVTVSNVNEMPTAVNDSFSVNEDATLNIAVPGVLSNDMDPEGNPLTAVLTTGASNGLLVLNADGSFTYTPNANFSGSDSFSYRAYDGAVSSNLSTVTITVTPINDVPVAASDTYTITMNILLAVSAPGVLANDTELEGNPLSASLVSGPSNGLLVFNADGSFLYTPNLLFTGVDTFTYQAADLGGNSNVATVTINVSFLNSPPNAVNDSYSVNEDTTLTVAASGVLANDSDPDSDPLTAVLVSGTSNGVLFFNADGSFSYSPNANFNGVDSFTYRADDGVFQSGLATVTISVVTVNDPPVANTDGYAVNEDGTLNFVAAGVLGNDSDVEGNSITAVLVSTTTNGSLGLNPDGSFNYTPNADFNGVDSFTYQANDGAANSNVVTVTITVNPVNDAPVANNDSYLATEDTTLIVAAPAVLGNDTDADSDPLTAVLVTGPGDGFLIFNADGSFSYTPNLDFNGVDSFTYQANDGTLDSNVETVTIFVNPVNDAPIANNDSYNVNEDNPLNVAASGVLANDVDPDDDPMTVALVSGPSNAAAFILNPDGSFSYTPAADFNGSDSFTYQANDGALDSNVVTVTVTVNPANDAPVANNDGYSVNEDSTLIIAALGVLGNDTGIDAASLTAVLVTGPSNAASFTFNADGSFSYTPNADFTGSDSFTYRVSDGNGGTATATVTLTVTPVNDPPVALDDAFTTAEDTSIGGNVLANDIDADGDTLSVVLVGGPSNGSVTLNPNGTFTYTPRADFHGTDSFTYTATDGNGGTATATVTLTVTPVNDPPVALDDAFTTAEDTSIGGNVIANDIDADGETLSVVLVGGSSNGSVILIADGTFVYTPAPDWSGVDSFSYRAIDQSGAFSSIVQVVIRVTSVPDAPEAFDDAYSMDHGSTFQVSAATGILANDRDREGTGLRAMLVAGSTHGTLTMSDDGSFSYSPDPGFAGVDSFRYRVSDGVTLSGIATVSIRVEAAIPTDPPIVEKPPPPSPEPAVSEPLPPNVSLVFLPALVLTDFIPSPVPTSKVAPEPEISNEEAPSTSVRPVDLETRSPSYFTVSIPAVVLPEAKPRGSDAPTPTFNPPSSQRPVESSVPDVEKPLPQVIAPSLSPIPQLAPEVASTSAPDIPASLLDRFDKQVDELQAETQEQTGTDAFVVSSGVAVAGYVLFNTRAMYWFLSAFLARPAVWRRFDPLEVIYAWEKNGPKSEDKDHSTDESLQSLVE